MLRATAPEMTARCRAVARGAIRGPAAHPNRRRLRIALKPARTGARPAAMGKMPPDPAIRNVTPLAAIQRVKSPPTTLAHDPAYWTGQMAQVSACQDLDCFMRLYDHFAPRLKRYLLGLNAPSAQVDDLVQEAMFRLWQRAASFDAERASVATWVFRIARNAYIDMLRREPAVSTVADDAADWSGEADDMLPRPVAPDAYADHAGLDRAIDALPATQARLIRMSYLEAKSHSEIAHELGMPLGSVKSTLRRAFARLKAGLGLSA
jgi:RNA polymerase sigma-70 factor, ECF subfamily